MRLSLSLASGIALLSLAGSLLAAEPQLMAGVATTDITPPPGLRMWGYSNRTEGATGTLDPLMAKAVVLETGETKVAIVTLDLGRVPEPWVLDRVHDQTRAKCGIEDLFITASHTHAAPSVEGTADSPNAFGETVGDAIVSLVCQAAKDLVPARLGVARGTAEIGHNRRKFLSDGRVAMQWRNAEREPTEPVDSEVVVVRLDRADGSTLAVLMHYACHPVVLGPDNLEYSADFVGAACGHVTGELGMPCLYLQGACGNINPYLDKTPRAAGGVESMRETGRVLGEAVAEIAGKLQTHSLRPPAIQFDAQVIPIRTRWDIEAPEVRAVLSKAYGARFDNYLATTIKNNIIPCTLTTLLIGDDLALVGMPGEIFVQFQQDLKRRSPVATTLLVGYTAGYHAYFPTVRDAAAGGYGGKTATYVEVGAGERLTDAALVELYRMTGKLHDGPREEDFQLLEYDEVRGK